MYERILVALKCDPGDQRVVEEAAMIASSAASSVILMHAIHTHTLDESAIREKEARACLAREAARLTAKGIGAVETLVMNGEPADAIVQAAADKNADLIVMAAHGHSSVRHVLMGSVTEDVVRRGDTPVLLVRP